MDNPNAKCVVIGLLGTRLDADTRAERWVLVEAKCGDLPARKSPRWPL